jgi:hypothetical protein
MCWEFVLLLSSGDVLTELILNVKPNTAQLMRILAFSWNLKVCYYIDRSLSQLNLVYTLVPSFFNVHFNVVLPSVIKSSKRSLPFKLSKKHPYSKSHIILLHLIILIFFGEEYKL